MRLERQAEDLTKTGDTDSDLLMEIYERLDELDAATAETKAAQILHGLGKSCDRQYGYLFMKSFQIEI